MIADQDRGYYIGASDVEKVIGNRKTKTWETWFLQKLSINRDHFSNVYTLAGTHYEHRILESLSVPYMELDKQIILEELRLRVNLDGNDEDTNYECKTTKEDILAFKPPKKYIHQVQVQMFASGLRKTKLVVYQLTEKEYNNFFLPIDQSRLRIFEIPYDEEWINTVYLPNHIEICECLKKGVLPHDSIVS